MRNCASRPRRSVEIAHRRRHGRTSSIRWNGAATTTSISATIISICWSRRNSPGLRRNCENFMKIAESGKAGGRSADGAYARSTRRSTMPSTTSPASPKCIRRSSLRWIERRGVCQDFAHIMIAIARRWGIPARYVSGYLYHQRQPQDRSAADATHAWVEAYLPVAGLGGLRSHQQYHRRRAPYPRRGGPRLCRRAADARHLQGRGATANWPSPCRVEPTQAPVRHEDFLQVARPMSAPTPTRVHAGAAVSPATTATTVAIALAPLRARVAGEGGSATSPVADASSLRSDLGEPAHAAKSLAL